MPGEEHSSLSQQLEVVLREEHSFVHLKNSQESELEKDGVRKEAQLDEPGSCESL